MKASRLCRDHIGSEVTLDKNGQRFTGILFRLEHTESYVTVSLHYPGKPDILRYGWVEQPLDPRDEVEIS